MWNELRGKWTYKAGASGTVTLPKGAAILQIVTEGAGAATCTIFGGDAIPCTSAAPKRLAFNHLTALSKPGAQDVVFTGTVSYFIEYTEPQP